MEREVRMSSYALELARNYKGGHPTLTERKAQENDGTMVTVICIAYNHAPFIAQALDSFLMQKTDFRYKIFVGEDKSTDATAEIIRRYAAEYPDIVIPFLREKNMGAQRNLIDLCQRATSPYLAFCEGDDYWTDDHKLQKQVDYMEAHENCRVSVMKTEILPPADWHLKSWYKPTKEGKYLIPDSIPGYEAVPAFWPSYILKRNVAHTSTHFYRWNYDLPIPDWYYQGIIGDTPLLLLQLGNSNLGFIPQVASVYRINEGSVFFDKDRERNFLRTRCDYIRYLSGFKDFATKYFRNYPIVDIENRIKLETANYLSLLVQKDDRRKIAEFFSSYPDAGTLSLGAFLSFYNDQRALTDLYTWDGYKMAVRNKAFRRLMRPLIRIVLFFKRIKDRLAKKGKELRKKLKEAILRKMYWSNTRKKKRDNLWIFAGFAKKSYLDNAKYLFEYVCRHHPEIDAYWVTMDASLFKRLREEGKPVLRMRTRECRRIVSQAAILVIDHFRMSDLDIPSGLNDGLKIVQLWHGVGLKSIDDLKNTDIEGVRYSKDILPQEGDSPKTLKRKARLYKKRAPFRELFERYFLLICPGKERILHIADPWGIPRENCLLSGHPRNILLHSMHPDANCPKILYAPTYRWEASREQKLVRLLSDSGELIQRTMEEVNGEFYIRLHPHTWRNYAEILETLSTKYDRIKIDRDKDVYKTLGRYSVMISDYSSIAYDFILLNRPVVFFNFDYREFVSSECKLNYDYDLYSPGKKTASWQETLDAVTAYLADPSLDEEQRKKVRGEFYDMSVNNQDDSERIVKGIKEKLSSLKRGDHE